MSIDAAVPEPGIPPLPANGSGNARSSASGTGLARTLELFDEDGRQNRVTEFEQAFASWLAGKQARDEIRSKESKAIYEAMWGALADWCVREGVSVGTLRSEDLLRYMTYRSRLVKPVRDLSPRYRLRLLRLVNFVLEHYARTHDKPPNDAARLLIKEDLDVRYAESWADDPELNYLDLQETRSLIAFLTDPSPWREHVQHTRTQSWLDMRGRASLALHLGAGLTPGEVRALQLHHLVVAGGPHPGEPWKVRVPQIGASPAREAPLRRWAGRILAQWLALRDTRQIAGPWLLPGSAAGEPLGRLAHYLSCKSLLAESQVASAESASGFALRHTYALVALHDGASRTELALALGIGNPTRIERYERIRFLPPGERVDEALA
jgi:hypothetical protein